MPDFTTLGLFFVAGMALLIVPGPAVLYIVARSIDQGRLAGIVSVLGIGLGTLFHAFAAALGVSAILMTSVLAFSVIKYLGAAYLIYLGIRTLLSRETAVATEVSAPKSLRRVFSEGIIVNVLNPKTALFFFAFLPQFADPAQGSVPLQMLVLGVLLVLMGIFSDGAYALLAGSVGKWLRGNLRFARGQRIFSGTVYIALGITTALSGSRSK